MVVYFGGSLLIFMIAVVCIILGGGFEQWDDILILAFLSLIWPFFVVILLDIAVNGRK